MLLLFRPLLDLFPLFRLVVSIDNFRWQKKDGATHPLGISLHCQPKYPPAWPLEATRHHFFRFELESYFSRTSSIYFLLAFDLVCAKTNTTAKYHTLSTRKPNGNGLIFFSFTMYVRKKLGKHKIYKVCV